MKQINVVPPTFIFIYKEWRVNCFSKKSEIVIVFISEVIIYYVNRFVYVKVQVIALKCNHALRWTRVEPHETNYCNNTDNDDNNSKKYLRLLVVVKLWSSTWWHTNVSLKGDADVSNEKTSTCYIRINYN